MRTAKRKPKPQYDPIKQRAKMVSDLLWERAVEVAKILAPDIPADHEVLPDDMQWQILERVASSLSPAAWDDPNAILDLYRLRKKFYPELAYPWLVDHARRVRSAQRVIPKPEETPQSRGKR
ncbi:MAG: hypothetical protein KatS3mg015_2882 [Fimbriimonadales bacterium]|nr:MAG: hypothetical protein KatS3mg015_2882 [Fimbriimonadales bacterium]